MQDDIPIFITIIALLVVILMPALGRTFGFADRLERMSDQVAQRHGLAVAEMREHHFAVPPDGAESSLLEEAECPVCLESGSRSWSALMRTAQGGIGRGCACGHLFCSRCARGLQATSRQCAICRAPFDSLVSLPDPMEDPRTWFAIVDADGDGYLSQAEVTNVLRLLFPREHESGALERELRELWSAWATDLERGVDAEHMMDAQHGLLAFYLRKKQQRTQPGVATAPGTGDATLES